MMLRPLDRLLNKITMYRLLVYGLGILAVISLLLSYAGILSFSFGGMLLSLGLILVGGFATAQLLAKIWRIPLNTESGLITSLILFFILPQTDSFAHGTYIFLAAVIAMASKFLIVRHRAHIFNPAALAAAVLSTAGLLYTSWWVGSQTLWPLTLILGLLVVRKIRRFSMVISFAVVSILVTIVMTSLQHQPLGAVLQQSLLASPLIFLGTIMLTEPTTMPSRRLHQMIFAALVGALYSLHQGFGSFYIYPETALILGNLYAHLVSHKYRVKLTLKQVVKVSDKVYDYIFTPDKPLLFDAGQYMEWTLPGVKADSRGNRRTFTIASSPTEADIHLGVKFANPASSYKRGLRNMQPGSSLYAGQVTGDFTLPADAGRPLVFIAGGIGITPFRSMLKYLIDSKQRRNIVLIYQVTDAAEFAFDDVLQAAAKQGVQVIKQVIDHSKPLDTAGLKRQIPDYGKRTFYISGSPGMVADTKKLLYSMGVSAVTIRADYFSGY